MTLKIYSQVESVGPTSCKVQVWGVNARTSQEVSGTAAVMVNMKDGRKIPLKRPA